MANRYTVLKPTTFDDIPLYQPNYAALDQVLGQQQQTHDLTMASIDALQPDALAQFQDESNAYYNNWLQKVEELPGMFKKDFKTGKGTLNKMLREAKKELTDPNSEFRHFANTKKAYLEGVKRIEEAHKKDPVKYNKKFAMNQLNMQLKDAKWKDFYADNKVKKNFSDPELIPYVDIQKDVVDIIGKIRSNIETEFTRDIERKLGRGWIEKIKTTETTAEDIQRVAEQLLQQPKYKDQLMVETWYKTQGVDFDMAESRYIDNLYENRDRLFKQLDKLPTKVADIKQLQSQLGVTADGIIGDDTKAALAKTKKEYNERLTKQLEDPNFSDTVKNKVINELVQKPYVDVAKGLFATKKVERSIQADEIYLTNLKLAQSRANNQALLRAMTAFIPKKPTDVLVTPNMAFDRPGFDKAKTTASELVSASNKNVKDVLSSNKVKDLFGTKFVNFTPGLPGSQPTEVNRTDEDIVQAVNVANNVFAKNIPYEDKVKEYIEATGADPILGRQQFQELTSGSLGKEIGGALSNQYEAQEDLDRLEEVETSLTTTYFEHEGKKQLNTIKKKFDLQDLSGKEISKLLNEGKKYTHLKMEKGELVGYAPILNKKKTIIGHKKHIIPNEFKGNIGKLFTSENAGYGSRTVNMKVNNSAKLLLDIDNGISNAVKSNPAYAIANKSYDILGGTKTALSDYTNAMDERVEREGLTGLVRELTGTAVIEFTADAGGKPISSDLLKDVKTGVLTTVNGRSLTLRGKDSDGKYYSTVIKVPETHKERLDNSIEQGAVNSYNKGEDSNYGILVDDLAKSNNSYKDVPAFKALRPNPNIANKTSVIFQDNNKGIVNLNFTTFGKPLKYKYRPDGVAYEVFMGEDSKGKPTYLLTRPGVAPNGEPVNVLIDRREGYFHDDLSDLTTKVNKIEAPKYFKQETTLEKIPKGFTAGTISNDQYTGAMNAMNAIHQDNQIID